MERITTAAAGQSVPAGDDLLHAKRLLTDGGYSCVLCRGETVLTSCQRGVTPMLEWLGGALALDGYAAADKVVGKAAAMLFVYAGVSQVYGRVMSRAALALFAQHGVLATYGALVDAVKNRAGTGLCPMELAVANMDDPAAALAVIIETRKRLMGAR